MTRYAHMLIPLCLASLLACSSEPEETPTQTPKDKILCPSCEDMASPEQIADMTPDAHMPDMTRDPVPDMHVADMSDAGSTAMPDLMTSDASADQALDECAQKPDLTVWLVGDSTVTAESGWGGFFESFLDEGVNVQNRAIGGRSSRSFYDSSSSKWGSDHEDAVLKSLAAGDYVIIQFGHNDQKNDERYTDPGEPPNFEGTYTDYLTRYIDDTEAVGASPILVTSVSRMTFGSDGVHSRTHGNYPAAVIRLATQRGIPVLDLEELSAMTFSGLGEEETLSLYAREGDRTHFYGDKARLVTEMVVSLLGDSDSPLRCRIER